MESTSASTSGASLESAVIFIKEVASSPPESTTYFRLFFTLEFTLQRVFGIYQF